MCPTVVTGDQLSAFLKPILQDFNRAIWSSMVYAGLFAIAKKNDPLAVLMVCKTGTVGANVIQDFQVTQNIHFIK